MLEKTTKLLMTGGGAPGAYGIIKCLREDPKLHITAADMREDCIGKLVADDFVQIPAASDPTFIETVLDFCISNNIQLIFPLVTKELILFSKQKGLFEENGIKVMVQENETLSVVNNKGSLYKRLKDSNVPVPAFSICKNIQDFDKACIALDYPSNTICYKPVNSNGMRGFRVLDPKVDYFSLWLNHKPHNTYTTIENTHSLLGHKECPPLLVTEFMPGEEYTLDVFIANGTVEYIIPRLRAKMINGISVDGEITENKTIIEYAKKIIAPFNLDGLFGIQVKYAVNGEPLILEINPRVQGTTVACTGANVNLPLIAVYYALNKWDKNTKPKVKWGVKFTRHWEEKYL